MLNRVRCAAGRERAFSIDWLQPRAAPTILVACGPRRISEAMSTMYDTDMLEPLAMGRWTLKADVSDESRTRKMSGRIGGKLGRGSSTVRVTAPSAMTVRMYHRARGGSSLSKPPQV